MKKAPNTLTETYGDRDQDVMNLRAGIAGLVFAGWSDDGIAKVAVEEAQRARRDLAEAVKAARSKPAI